MVLHGIDQEADNCENDEEDNNDERYGDVSFDHFVDVVLCSPDREGERLRWKGRASSDERTRYSLTQECAEVFGR